MKKASFEMQYNYPNRYDAHMIDVPDKVDLPILDANYPYRDKRLHVKALMFVLYLVIQSIVFVILKITTGAKIKNKKVLKQYADSLNSGAITVSNHVHMWDFLCIMLAVRPKRLYYPAWATNLKGPNRHCIRLTGGIPIPNTLAGLRCFYKTMDEILQEKRWLHFFAEGSMWHYYKGIRPFKTGAFKLSIKNKVPIIPIAINYRQPKGLFKLLHSHAPLLTVNVGEPISPVNEDGSTKTVRELLDLTRQKIQELAGFDRVIFQSETEQQAANF
jgi:1-acyl-sn-glycerol-3-phosphate acyltransferase